MKKWMVVGLACCLLLAAGCGEQKQETAVKTENQVVLPYPENMQKLGFTESVVLPKQPERVISLANTLSWPWKLWEFPRWGFRIPRFSSGRTA